MSVYLVENLAPVSFSSAAQMEFNKSDLETNKTFPFKTLNSPTKYSNPSPFDCVKVHFAEPNRGKEKKISKLLSNNWLQQRTNLCCSNHHIVCSTQSQTMNKLFPTPNLPPPFHQTSKRMTNFIFIFSDFPHPLFTLLKCACVCVCMLGDQVPANLNCPAGLPEFFSIPENPPFSHDWTFCSVPLFCMTMERVVLKLTMNRARMATPRGCPRERVPHSTQQTTINDVRGRCGQGKGYRKSVRKLPVEIFFSSSVV